MGVPITSHTTVVTAASFSVSQTANQSASLMNSTLETCGERKCLRRDRKSKRQQDHGPRNNSRRCRVSQVLNNRFYVGSTQIIEKRAPLRLVRHPPQENPPLPH